jgi:hypothetical protein
MLPLLRRAFADFSGPERRMMGEKVKRLRQSERPAKSRSADRPSVEPGIQLERARLVLPILRHILGAPTDPALAEGGEETP